MSIRIKFANLESCCFVKAICCTVKNKLYNRTMILSGFKDFPRHGRLMGIDWGARRIGVAVSDESQGFVFARGTIPGDNGIETGDMIKKIILDEKIVGIVVGLPLHADGTDSATTKMVREFADGLAAATDTPIVFIEENLTSHAAACERQETRDKRQGLDSISAKIILENAIAMINRGQSLWGRG
jgi:putative Holliday junction resolvase